MRNSNASLRPQGDRVGQATHARSRRLNVGARRLCFVIGSVGISSNNSKVPGVFLVLHRLRENRFKETSIGPLYYYALGDSSFAIRADGGTDDLATPGRLPVRESLARREQGQDRAGWQADAQTRQAALHLPSLPI